jgi:hypothetical protein
MLSQMAYIVFHEKRPFSYVDLLEFEFEGISYRTAYGTVRNDLSKLVKSGEIEISYRSIRTFYTLKGYKFGKPMTPNHTVVHNNPICNMLQDLPLDKRSIHDIHLRFNAPGIWNMFSINLKFPVTKRNKDIAVGTWKRENAMIRIIIHKTDVVSIILGCSSEPILLEFNGIIRLFTVLARAEEKLQTILNNYLVNANQKNLSVPEYKSWIVTMWHFGRDSLIEFAQEKFCVTVESAQHILTRLYVKEVNGKNRIRIERQEYPRKTILDAIEEKLDSHSNSL